MNDYVRKMAEIVKIEEIKAIPDADKICAYRVLDGWWVVDLVGAYQVGDLVCFAQIDSWIPNSISPFLSKGKEPRVYNGVAGEKLRTIRLKKQLSQGLLIPISKIPPNDLNWDDPIGTDVTELLGIQKWEAPPEFRSADAKGSFPSFICKTDQPRIQGYLRNIEHLFDTETWSMEEKADGSSHTMYYYNGEFGVCSRNLELKYSEDNTFWKVVVVNNLQERLVALGKNIAIQSELCGPGIQGNPYGLSEYMIFTFDVFDVDKQDYVSPDERNQYVELLGLRSVPIISKNFSLKNYKMHDLLKLADGKSVLGFTGTIREGLVFKLNSDRRVSFKVISNEFLEKQK